MIASSENLDNASQLQSQEPPEIQTPTLALPASHNYHKRTNFAGCREPKSWAQQKSRSTAQKCPVSASVTTPCHGQCFPVRASRVLNNNPGSENSPIMIKTLREIFWMTTFEVLWMTLRRIHITWKVWSMFPKITAFFFYTKSVALHVGKSKLCLVEG